MKLRLLFICTGNTCRSPLAEGLAQKVFADWDVDIHSAGLSAWDGDLPSQHVLQLLTENGIDLSQHRARRLRSQWVEDADYVIPMTKAQERLLRGEFPNAQNKIRTLGSWGGTSEDVEDPFGGSLERYRQSAEQIEELLWAMKRTLQEENKDKLG